MADGKCGAHHYGNITQAKINAMLSTLKSHGYAVSGNNPWNVDTKQYGVKLQGSWNAGNATLTIIVTDKDFFVPCSKIWDQIDPLIQHLTSLSEQEFAA